MITPVVRVYRFLRLKYRGQDFKAALQQVDDICNDQ